MKDCFVCQLKHEDEHEYPEVTFFGPCSLQEAIKACGKYADAAEDSEDVTTPTNPEAKDAKWFVGEGNTLMIVSKATAKSMSGLVYES